MLACKVEKLERHLACWYAKLKYWHTMWLAMGTLTGTLACKPCWHTGTHDTQFSKLGSTHTFATDNMNFMILKIANWYLPVL